MGALTVAEFYEHTKDSLQLEILGNPEGFKRMITMPDASGPGLVLAGYTGRFVHQRIQVLGETEVSYLSSLSVEERHRNLTAYFAFEIPLVMVTKGLVLPDGFEEAAHRAGVTILRSRSRRKRISMGRSLTSLVSACCLLAPAESESRSACSTSWNADTVWWPMIS
ncbi:MAG: hypothetical protein NTU67_01940 [Gemmatimonadetes bacterium]|nr:hypothetical protein [Gemmatimonadota bacterium]